MKPLISAACRTYAGGAMSTTGYDARGLATATLSASLFLVTEAR